MADNEDLAARLASIDKEIGEARRRLSTLRHEGERHFIDDQPVDPALTEALRTLLAEHDRIHPHADAGATAAAAPAHDDLAALEARIRDLRAGPQDTTRHFIDG